MEIKLSDIESFEYVNDVDVVYDIEVAESHSYVLEDDILVHNSGKSYAIMQFFAILLSIRNKITITVWRGEKTVCRATVMKDFQEILYSDYSLSKMFEFNKTQATFTHKKTGSQIIFEGADQVGKVLGMKQHISFFNEITEFNEAVFLQIQQRTSETIFTDYNPSKSFFLEKIMYREDVAIEQFTYKDNAFCPANIIKTLDGYNPNIPENVANGTANEYMYKVYCLGIKAEVPGRVYSDFDRISLQDYYSLPYPEEFSIDFGLVSPTALSGIKFDGDNTFYVNELLYKPINMMKHDLVSELNELVSRGLLDKSKMMIADFAGKQYITKMRNDGFYVVKSIKGSGSILSGIDDVKSVRIVITNTSSNLIMENENYSYVLDRFGEPTEALVQKDDHLLDNLKYLVVHKLRSLGR